MRLTPFILHTIAFLTISVFSSPPSSSKCVVFQQGYLSTHEEVDDQSNPIGYQWFAFNYKDELAFYHHTSHEKIYAEFQECTPNWAGSNNFLFMKWGRIYVPKYQECLAVTNVNGNEPYTVKRVPCLNSANGEIATAKSIPQNWVVDSKGFMTWSGETKENGSVVQGDGACTPGTYGYLGNTHNEPVTTNQAAGAPYKVQLVCIWDQDANAFFFTQT